MLNRRKRAAQQLPNSLGELLVTVEPFMQLTELLTAERVAIRFQSGRDVTTKNEALAILANLLVADRSSIANSTVHTPSNLVSRTDIERVLTEREALQSTGIGDGVAIPHGALPQLDAQRAALLLVPGGVEFQAIDGMRVTILFAVIGPKRATGEHLKTLARVSRLLRNKSFRDKLVAAADAQTAYELIATEEASK